MANIYSHRDGSQAAVIVNGKRKKKNIATMVPWNVAGR